MVATRFSGELRDYIRSLDLVRCPTQERKLCTNMPKGLQDGSAKGGSRYRTVSGAGHTVITGIPPVDLIANERAQWHREKLSFEADELFRAPRQPLVIEDQREMATSMGLSARRLVDPLHNPRRRKVDIKETRTRHLPPGSCANRVWVLPQLHKARWRV